jgi:hypothetical protein
VCQSRIVSTEGFTPRECATIESDSTFVKPKIPKAPLLQTHRGYPTVDELMQEQGVGPIKDPSELLGDFWPEEEPIERFLEALHEWRGHRKNDRAA